MSCLFHVQGIHKWADGRCEHDMPYIRDAEEPDFLDPTSASFRNIQKVVADPKLLQDIPRYLQFR